LEFVGIKKRRKKRRKTAKKAAKNKFSIFKNGQIVRVFGAEKQKPIYYGF
jgi:hypothetical protein